MVFATGLYVIERTALREGCIICLFAASVGTVNMQQEQIMVGLNSPVAP